ncbi:aspartate racemase [Caulobacter sp. AP07]|uniref:aspartate/glutamate racemase family protein n=1 Tax=Caulobacter sp. AP07 TaxID=1144304 RepID=UPI0002720C82|nr:amino acid racemase [Caulobacter sp. AP07]EJL25238.1 aspartate racemase [Caulobacter sp. AP07]
MPAHQVHGARAGLRRSARGEGGRPAGTLIGVLGGMGPAATLDFLGKLQANTPADVDQDHWPVLTFSASQVPDRTAAILGHGESPLPAMREGLAMLARAGASCAAIPCNTAHHWFDELQASTDLTLVHIVDAVASELKARRLPGSVGLLATTGTVQARIYQRRLDAHGIATRTARDQAAVMRAIEDIKAGRLDRALPAVIGQVRELLDAGCDAVVLGCTELPLLAPDFPPALRAVSIDTTDALARACLRTIDAIARGQAA